MKKHATTILLVIIFTLGLGMLLYPSVSDWWNSRHQSRAIATYTEAVSVLEENEVESIMKTAIEYNELVSAKIGNQFLTDEDLQMYNNALDISGTGVMAYIEIPTINVSLPVYHGVSDSVLQIAVGHLQWTSLPIGGESTHCVISGHRGLPSAKLFTNLDELVEGDVFMLHFLNETITYQVDQILIVEPEDTSALNIVEGMDLCTLVTCTPYGIDSHRLLVRGHRIANVEETPEIIVISEAGQIDPLVVAPVVAAPMLLVLLLYVLIRYRKKK